MNGHYFLEKLIKQLSESSRAAIYPCVGDLIVNGIQASRFDPSEHLPNRQAVTQYLAAWCRDAGLSEVTCRNWLSEFALAILSVLSKSSPSGIRHSTKSNVKYIYRRNPPFICQAENNPFRAACSKTCPRYQEMSVQAAKQKAEFEQMMLQHQLAAANNAPSPASGKREPFYEQFQEALQCIREELAKGTKKTRILKMLKEKGLKNSLGRPWNYNLLLKEIRTNQLSGQLAATGEAGVEKKI